MGKVVKVDVEEHKVQVRPLLKEIEDDLLDFNADDLTKFFEVGSHVKIVQGAFTGETGTIVQVEEPESASGIPACDW